MTTPVLTFQNYTTPYANITSVTYTQTSPGGSGLPVLQGTDSDHLFFRIYNNWALSSNIANALNVFITTYDGIGTGSHTATKPVVSQTWIHVYENGYGENSVTPGVYTVYGGSDHAVGGANVYVLDKGSNGVAGSSVIRAYSNNAGVGFVELQSYARVPANATNGTTSFAISCGFEWSS